MAETKTETKIDTPKMKPRPIVRLGVFIISHSIFFSVVCCISGVLALLLLPVLAKNTYISENALMPGSASPILSNQDVSDGSRLVKELTSVRSKPEDMGMESRRLIAQYMSDLGAEVSYHKFHPGLNQFHPLHFFSGPDARSIQENLSCLSYGVNTVGIIRAARGDGKEAIVLVTPYNSESNNLDGALSLGIMYSVFSLLTRVTWLAKDIIWVVADSRYGEYASVAAWLKDYHTPLFSNLGTENAEMCEENDNLLVPTYTFNMKRKTSDGIRRAGTMAAALVLKVGERSADLEDTLSIYAEASNGQMPNLDLINVVNYLAVHRQGFHVKVEKFWSLLDSTCLKSLGGIFEFLGTMARSINPEWKFGIPVADYIEGTATLASSLYRQALGIPTGPHGAFRDYQVDAITLKISPRVQLRHNDFLLRGGRLIEGVIRSVNNLLEKFHQSFFLYLLTSPSKFVSVGVYMIAFALLVAPLPMVAASLYLDANNPDRRLTDEKSTSSPATSGNERDITLRSWKWLNAAKKVFAVQLWGVVVSLFPYFISRIPSSTPTTCFGIWVSLSMLMLIVLFFIMGSPLSRACASGPQKREWALLKSVTISVVFIGLSLMSVINFATAEIGALLIVPMCLMAHPLKLDVRAWSLRNFSRMICNIVLGLIGFPPTAFFILKWTFEGFGSIDFGNFWNWVESLWVWNSATYLYIGMVHLPCWLLCIQILSHPS